MSKSLSMIQTIAKIARIVCKVIFILCIVGGVGCLVGLLALLVFGRAAIDVFGLEASLGFNPFLTGAFGCIVGMITCAGEAVVAYYGERYFSHELKAGTPFTHDGAKEIFRLGIISLIVSAAATVISGVVFGVMMMFMPKMHDVDVSTSWSLGTGLALLLLSVIFRYGAELREQNAEPKAEWVPPYEEPLKEEPTADAEQSATQSFDVL